MINVTFHCPTRAILFSDLHYSYKTKDTCFEVLRYINKYAQEKACRVYFLGDFWDHIYRRGTVPVDLLNEMVRFFHKEWRCLMTMIPGNHDYFDSEETEHGLEAFSINDRIRIINNPTIEDGILFLPYTRHYSELGRIIEEANPKIILGHLDIVGAKMNHSRTSTVGCDKSMFKVPTYTGHYHTATSYGNVHYIGSPYQIHLGEAGDEKTLTVINYKTGEVETKLPVQFGRRHFKVKSLKDLPVIPREGDRVVIESAHEEDALLIKQLKDKGIVVEEKKKIELRKVKNLLDIYEDPFVLFEKLKSFETDDLTKVKELFRTDAELKALYDRRKKQKTTIMVRKVEFTKMIITNFGPFVGTHTMDFIKGITLYTGSYGDKSNGAGKSLCSAGALLWVCAGRSDPRMGGQPITNDIISIGKKSCHVILNGTLNGKDFTIARNMTRKPRSHSITFHLGGNNCAGATITRTQEQIGTMLFGTTDVYEWLIKSVIWTQRHHPKFIDATDSQAKKELCTLIDLEWWKRVYERVKLMLREYGSKIDTLEYAMNNLIDRIENKKTSLSKIKRSVDDWNDVQFKKVENLRAQMASLSAEITEDVEFDHNKYNDLRYEFSRQVNPLDGYRKPEHLVKEWCMRANKNEMIKKQIKRLQTSGVCETCLSVIDPSKIEDHKKELESQISSFSDITKKIDDHLENYKKEQLEKTEKRKEVIKEELDKMNAVKEQWVLTTEKKNALETVKNEFKLETEKENPYADTWKWSNRELEQLHKDHADLAKKYNSRKRTYYVLMSLKAVVGPKCIQTRFLHQTLHQLEYLIKTMMEDEKFELGSDETNSSKIRKMYNGQKLSIMSGGEYQHLQVASFLAYRHLLNQVFDWSCNVMILDEPDTFVDASGVKRMMNMIKKQTENMSTIIISHTNSMHRDMSLFEHHIEIERDNNGSRKRKRI